MAEQRFHTKPNSLKLSYDLEFMIDSDNDLMVSVIDYHGEGDIDRWLKLDEGRQLLAFLQQWLTPVSDENEVSK